MAIFVGAGSFFASTLVAGCARYASAESNHTRDGFVLLHRGDYAAATNAFDQVLSADPQSAEAYYGRACAHGRAGEYDAAISDYSSAIRLDPRMIDYQGRAWTYEEKGDKADALADFNQAIKLEPQDALLYLLRARLDARMNQVGLVESDINRASALAGDAPGLAFQIVYPWILATSPSEKIRNVQSALRLARIVSDQAVPNAAVFDTLAVACAENGQFDEAVKSEKEALNLEKSKTTRRVIVLREINERLALFEKREPYRESQL
jgi:tetratricopeptide (TPR) repeat protein